ncbi:hypothetical protein GCM10022393_43150 [Aquimarina addita]|uniref:DUF1795 domain-containing protein n=1 Tax=Aquimarina addita TaxID=870485 RepID=A0ABP6UZ57_9FLAO
MSSDLNKTKKIYFYNGLISFNIPSDWIEEYESEETSGTFYEDIPFSGTFRIRLLMLNSPNPMEKKDVLEVLNADNQTSNNPIILQNGNAYKKFIDRTIDSGHNITIYYWSLANINSSNSARLANFSYTVLTEFENEKWVQNEIRFLNREIEKVDFKD